MATWDWREKSVSDQHGKSEVHVWKYGGKTMLATFAFDVCHDVYQAAREVIDTKIPTVSLESSGKYLWHPDRMPRLAEYVADFARAGERALGDDGREGKLKDRQAVASQPLTTSGSRPGSTNSSGQFLTKTCPTRASRMVMFRMYYLGGADYQAARRNLGISEFTWADWAEEIRAKVGKELASAGVFPPSKYFHVMTARAS
jgi:hypothetical protein